MACYDTMAIQWLGSILMLAESSQTTHSRDGACNGVFPVRSVHQMNISPMEELKR